MLNRKFPDDLKGYIFGGWTVVDGPIIRKLCGRNRKFYQCRCSCDDKTISWVNRQELTSGRSAGCRCKVKNYRYLERGESCLRGFYNSYKRAALNRNLKFDLSKTYFTTLVFNRCCYCLSLPYQTRRIGRGSNGYIIANGIDRVMNDVGYIRNNVVSCCTVCNYAKHSMSISDFSRWLIRLSRYQYQARNGLAVETLYRFPAVITDGERNDNLGLSIGVAPINGLIATYRRRAKTDDIQYNLDKELFIQLISNNCIYCGTEPTMEFPADNKLRDKIIYNGIDRLDNKGGYVNGNVATCCYACNIAKRDLKTSEFSNWLKKVSDIYGSVGV